MHHNSRHCVIIMALLPFIKNKVFLPAFTDYIDYLCVHFCQMNDILGNDYEKKMAVVGVLKQYAEDRDLEMLARALAVLLKEPQHQKLIRQIR